MLNGLLKACGDSGRGRVVVLRGEAGIGKSRLTEEIARLARKRDFATHRTLILDFGTGKGQDAMRLLTRSLLMIAPGSDKQQRKAAADQAIAIGWLGAEDRPSLDDLLDIPSEGEERALYQAMDEATRQSRRRGLLSGLIKRLAAERPLFLTVEDAHWADAGLLDDLAALAAVTTEAPLVLAITYAARRRSARPQLAREDRLGGRQHHRPFAAERGGIGVAGGRSAGQRR